MTAFGSFSGKRTSAASSGAGAAGSVLTVSQVNRYLAFKLKEDGNLRLRRVRGELSNFTCHSASGHLYFTLKDSGAGIRCVMFRNYTGGLGFRPANGMEVVATASIQVYEKDGSCQLYVTEMVPAGAGAAQISLEQLREQLAAEGLFALERKRPLPKNPACIGVVTAAEGAALQDILNILNRRYPIGRVKVFPALVQGAGAPDSLCKALQKAGESRCDALIIGRGGGAAEDLSAFNQEAVVRAVAACKTPVISAVGHETDVTLTDFAADVRAPTPSAAAELAAPDQRNILEQLQNDTEMLYNTMIRLLERQERQANLLETRLQAASVRRRMDQASYRLEEALRRLSQLWADALEEKERRLQQDVTAIQVRMARLLARKLSLLESKTAALAVLDPLAVLERGYAVVYQQSRPVRDARELSVGEEVRVQLGRGAFTAAVTSLSQRNEDQ